MRLTTAFQASLVALSVSCFSEPRQHSRLVDSPDGPPAGRGEQPAGPEAGSVMGSPSVSTDGPLDPDSPAGPGPSDASSSGATCGNGVIEPGEECEGNCPTACPPRGCAIFTLQGSAERCTARCVEGGMQTACSSADGCCPAGCTMVNDVDCSVRCDNGVREAGETCEPLSSCPAACPAVGCQIRKLVNPGTCAAECVDDRQQTTCASGDGCCPSTCNSNNDTDCQPRCGNGVRESSERCDPLSSCPSSCPNQGCQLRRLVGGGTCEARCEDAGTQNECRTGDGCCPGSSCSFSNDRECPVRCGDAADGMCPSGCSFSQDSNCKKPNGQGCGGNGECQSGRCTGGVCCNNGQNGCDGRCVGNNDRNNCGSSCTQCGTDEVCTSGRCELDCGTSGKRCCPGCDSDLFCDRSNICRARIANGRPCDTIRGGESCRSGRCQVQPRRCINIDSPTMETFECTDNEDEKFCRGGVCPPAGPAVCF